MSPRSSEDVLLTIKNILEKYPGNAQVYVSLQTGAAVQRVKAKSQVRLSKELLRELRTIPEINQITEQ